MVHEKLQTEMINIYRSVWNNETRQKIRDNIWLSRLNGACEQFLQRFSLPVSPCSCSCNSVCQADGGRGEGAVTERPVKCKQSQGHVTGSKVTGSTWIMFHLLWFHCKNNSLLTFLDHLWMLSTRTCMSQGGGSREFQWMLGSNLLAGRRQTELGSEGRDSEGCLRDMGSTIFVATFKRFQEKLSWLWLMVHQF